MTDDEWTKFGMRLARYLSDLLMKEADKIPDRVEYLIAFLASMAVVVGMYDKKEINKEDMPIAVASAVSDVLIRFDPNTYQNILRDETEKFLDSLKRDEKRGEQS